MIKDSKKEVRPKQLLSKKALVGWAVGIVVVFVSIGIYTQTILPTGQMAAVITSTLVDLANGDRQTQNLGTLTVNPKLVAAAQAKADDMAAKGYFAHTSPDGRTSWSWFKDAGYSFSHAGENLAVNFSDSVNVNDAWMNSPTHRANILNGNFSEVGIATAVGEYQGKKTIFVVQMFGTPAQVIAEKTSVQTNVPTNPEELATASTKREPEVLGSESVPPPTEKVAASIDTTKKSETSAKPVVAESAPEISAPLVTAPKTFASSPHTLLRSIYLAAAFVLLLMLVFRTRFELRRHHVRHVYAVVALIILMGGLFLSADRFLFPTLAIGQSVTETRTTP